MLIAWTNEVDAYPAVPRPWSVEPNFASRPILEIKPTVPRPVTVLVSSIGSIIELILLVRPMTVEFMIVVKPIVEIKPAVPRPMILEASSTGSIMLEILLVIPIMEDWN